MKSSIPHIGAFVVSLLLTANAFAQDAQVTLGTTIPLADRAMPSANGSTQSLGSLAGANGTVLIFWSNNCPWVDKYEDRVADLVSRFGQQGFGFVLVNSNDPVAFPEESVDGIRERAASSKYAAAYVLDEGSELAQALGATRTPHVFVFDGARALVYEGAIDDSPGDPGDVKEKFLDDVLTAASAGNRASVSRTTSFGCRIKYVQ